MVNVPGGTFMMGSPPDELARSPSEGPQRKVAMAPFAIGLTEVTYAQWNQCVADGGCGGYIPPSKAEDRASLPVVQVSWRDATSYAEWLSKKTGRVYRLPSEAEWEYAARGGTTTPFWWGALFDAAKAGVGPASQEVNSLPDNPLGLKGVTGNVREWVEDCYVDTFAKAPHSTDDRSRHPPAPSASSAAELSTALRLACASQAAHSVTAR